MKGRCVCEEILSKDQLVALLLELFSVRSSKYKWDEAFESDPAAKQNLRFCLRQHDTTSAEFNNNETNWWPGSNCHNKEMYFQLQLPWINTVEGLNQENSETGSTSKRVSIDERDDIKSELLTNTYCQVQR